MYIKPRWFENLKNARILAVNPPVYDFAWFDLWAKPAGLLNFLGYLQSLGNSVELIDCMYEGRTRPISHGRWRVRREERPKPAALHNVPRSYYRFGLSEEDFRLRLLEGPRPDIILLTSIMTYWYPGVAEAIERLRAAFPNRPIILGGIYATLCPDHAATLGADQVLPASATPYADSLPLNLYPDPGHALISTSRGCPRRCHYCASALIHPHFSPRPLAEILNDLDSQVAGNQLRDLAFYDDALLWDKENIFYPLVEQLAEKFPQLNLHSPNGLSVGSLDERCCRALRQAGFKTLRLSFEGLDSRTKEASDNKVTGEAYLRAVGNLIQAGFESEQLETYLLLGLPGQAADDLEASIEFVKRAGAKPKLCEYSPIPGTKFFKSEAELFPIIADEPLWHNNSVYMSYLTGRVEAEELQRLKSKSRQACNQGL